MGKRSSFDFEEGDEVQEALQRAGKALLSPPKGKDQLLRLLKGAGESLAEAAQSSESVKLAARDLAKALGRPDFLRHKDKEVRLYTALCLCHILRLHAPDTPYTDAELQAIFELLNSTYALLEDPGGPHFQLCLSILETVSQVKCSLLILDLPSAEELTCSLFTTLLDAVNEENAGVLEGTVLELLRSMIEEADDIPQQQLDILLYRLLPAHAQDNPAGSGLVAALLQRTQTTVQPYLQKLLTALLLGGRTDSELKGDYHSLFYAVHETLPQAVLPLMPLLKEEVEAEGGNRAAAVELVSRLLTQHPSGGGIIEEYGALFDALLGRTHDSEADVRRKLLDYAQPLIQVCAGHKERQLQVLRAVVARLMDPDDRVRQAAAAAVCALLTAHPWMATSTHTEGRGTVLACLGRRLRDKKPAVRREVAAQLAALARSWVLAAEGDPTAAPRTQIILSVPLVLCNWAVGDPELGAYVLDTVFRSGIFPAKLAPADVARWWALMWCQAGEEGQSTLTKILRGKASMQHKVQELLALRAAAKEQQRSRSAAAAAGAASSMGGTGGAGGAGGGGVRHTATAAASGSVLGGAPSAAMRGQQGGQQQQRQWVDPERQLSARMSELVAVLRDVSKPEEGLQRLMDQKDNHVFKGLATLATFGCTYKDAVAAGKDVMQRVGSKGPAADLVRVLVARLTPSLLPPEVLHAAMEQAEQSQEAQRLLVDVAGAAPQLLAQSLDAVLGMLEEDDPLLAECGAKVVARAGRAMLAHHQQAKREVPQALVDKLSCMCTEGGSSPSGTKAAVKALVVVLGAERAAEVAADLADQLMDLLKSPATLASHHALLAALKGLSMLGRLLPDVFDRTADELTDWVLHELLPADLSRGKPLLEQQAGTGRDFRLPSSAAHIKCAALRTLCQALVPDSSRAKITQAMSERAQQVWEVLEPLVETDPEAPQFAPFDLHFPTAADEDDEVQQRGAKRRRVEGGGSDEEEEEEEEELPCTDAAYVRYSAVCGLLRLARAHDAAMPAALYANLALALQEPLPGPRHAMTVKLGRAVSLFSARPQGGQRAAKYAAVLAMLATDPEQRNFTYALRTLREYALQRRRVVAAVAQSAAAAGEGGVTLIQELPEFLLPFLVWLLAHHPEYPTQEVLEEFSQASPEEQQEMYGGGTPFDPFLAMLQFALEALVVPSEHPTNPAEVARLLPPSLKLLRTLKFCDDACSEPRTEEARQLCDLAMLLLRQLAVRLTKGKPQEPGRFPGQTVLPRMCFRPNMHQPKRPDGSNLPDERYFNAGLYQDDLFMRRMLMPALPGPTKASHRPRSKPRAPKRTAAAAAAAAEDDEAMSEAHEDESAGASPQGSALSEDEQPQQQQQQAGSSGRHRAALAAAGAKQQQLSSPSLRGRKRRGQPPTEEEAAQWDEGVEGQGQGEQQEEEQMAPRTKKAAPAAAAGKKRAAPSGRSKPAAGTPSRQQPRRGAKTEAVGRMRDESSSQEEEEEEAAGRPQRGAAAAAGAGQQQRQGRGGGGRSAAGAAGARGAAQRRQQQQEESEEERQHDEDPMTQSDFENASLGSPEATPGKLGRGGGRPAAAAAAKAGHRSSLRANTEDEELSEQQQQQQGQQRIDSPGQENRGAGNGGAAAARRGVLAAKGKVAAAKPAGKAKAASGAAAKPAAAKAQQKRLRA